MEAVLPALIQTPVMLWSNAYRFSCVKPRFAAFGGPDFKHLFVTTGQHKTLNEASAGSVFIIEGLSAQGLPTYPYRGPVA